MAGIKAIRSESIQIVEAVRIDPLLGQLDVSLLPQSVQCTFFCLFSQLTPLHLKFAAATASFDCLGHDHEQVNGKCDEDKKDEVPAAEIAHFSIWHEGGEHDETVAAHQRHRLIEQVHVVGEGSLEGLEVARVQHEDAALEDHKLNLKVAPIDPENHH